MSSHPRSPRDGKRNILSRVFNKLRRAPRSHEAPLPSTHTSAPVQQSLDRRPVDQHSTTPGNELQAGEYSDQPLPPQTPNIRVEDHSRHHYGDTYTTQNINGTANTVGTVVNATFGTHSVTTIERAFFSSGNESVLLWDTLPKQRDIGGPENEYLDGSREDVVQDTLGWFEDRHSELGFLIQGAAGLGKSTFARHLTHRLHAVGRLAASVSLSALPSDVRSPSSVVKMTARELGATHPKAIPAILEAVKSCQGAPLAEDAETLLIGPIRSLGLSHPLAVIFDAVDEYESHSALIKAFSSLPATTSSSIKFILLGRSNFRGRNDAAIRLYPLQPVSTATMECFLSKHLEEVHWEHGRHYAQARMTRLAELANGLFIWARVVCSLLQKRLGRFPPDHILDSILDARRSLGESDQLATLYHQAIMLLFPDPEDLDLFREYLTATIALQKPLPVDEFSAFTKLPIRVIDAFRIELRALQIRHLGGVEESSAVYPAGELFHLSFLEYLESTSTPAHIAFQVLRFDSHSRLAEFCLTDLPRFLPSSRPLSHLDLNPRERYAVTYLMVHIHHGSPLVQPGSDEDWVRSSHRVALRQSSFELLQQWADLFVDLVASTPVSEGYIEDAKGLDPMECSDEDGPLDNQRAWSDSESNNLSGENDAADDGDTSQEGVDHDTRVAQLLHGVATNFWEEEYTSRSPFQTGCLEVAIRFRPDDTDGWYCLGWAYHTVEQGGGSVKAHDRAVTALQHALRGADEPTQHDPGRFPYALATALYERFWDFGRPEDLDQSISLHRNALARRPPGHPRRGWSLNNLACVLDTYVRERGCCTGEMDEVIGLQREALDLLPQGHEDTGMYLCNLADNLKSRYEMVSSTADLEEAIHLGREALALCPLGHPDYVWTVDQLAWNLTLLYEVLGDRGSLEEAVRLSRESTSLCPTGYPDRRDSLGALSNALRFLPDQLDEALQLSRESLSLTPLNHPDRWEILMRLGSILLSHYERFGSAEDLEEATSICKQGSTLCPPKHFRRPKLLALQAKLAEAASLSSFVA